MREHQVVEIPLDDGDVLMNVHAFAAYVRTTREVIRTYLSARNPGRNPIPKPEPEPWLLVLPELTEQEHRDLSLILSAASPGNFWRRSAIDRWERRREKNRYHSDNPKAEQLRINTRNYRARKRRLIELITAERAAEREGRTE